MNMSECVKNFCNRVRSLREESELTLADLAERSGVPLEILEQLEENILPEELMVDDAFALSKVLCCEIYELFE